VDQTKRKRLEAKGWKFGSAAEFLGLSDEESIYVELRLRLTEALKRRRQSAKLSQTALAGLVGSSQSRVAKMEANHQSVSLDLLITSLIGLGVGLDELGEIIGSLNGAKKQ
jgi:predicted XRE-type DNA-binding protein